MLNVYLLKDDSDKHRYPAKHYMVVYWIPSRQGFICPYEVTSTGLHGANILALHPLLEALVFCTLAYLDSKDRLSSFFSYLKEPQIDDKDTQLLKQDSDS
jgi:hypothetical protein